MAKSTSYELAIKIAGKVEKSLGKSVDQAEKNLSKLGKTGEAVGSVMGSIGKASIAGMATLTAASLGAGKYLYDLGSEFDDAIDTIRIGTGATGEDLDALNESMKNVYATVPAEMSDAANAISDYNTRLGVTDDVLEELSSQALQASDMLGEDLTGMIEGSSQAFQQWSIAEEQMADKMDYIFKVSQSTGIGMTDLFARMQTYGPQLQDMGYSFEEAAAMMGQMEKAGVNTDEVLAAMKKSVGTLAKDGLSASKGLEIYYQKIQNAGTAAEAAAIANEVFGARAGSTMASAIRDGTLAVDDFVSSLEANNETINGAAWDTYDFAEKFELMKHEAEIALAPLADTIFNSASDILPAFSGVLEELAPVVSDLTGSLDLDMLGELASEIAPVVSDLISESAPVLAQILPIVTSVLGDLITGALPALLPLLDPLLQIILILAPLLESLGPCVTVLAQILSTVLVDAIAVTMPIIEGLTTVLTGVLDFITNVFTGNFSAAFENLVSIFSGIWDTLKAAFAAPINFIIRGLNHFIGYLNNLTIPDWVPGVGGKGLEFSLIPEIALAEGGIAMGPTNALIAEAGEPEAVIPLSKLPTLLRDFDTPGSPAHGSGDGPVYYITFAPVIHYSGNKPDEIPGIMEDEYERFKAFMDEYMHENDRVKF